MKKKFETDFETVAKAMAFNIAMALSSAGIVVHKNSLEKLRKSLQANLQLDRMAQQYDDFLAFRINEKRVSRHPN